MRKKFMSYGDIENLSLSEAKRVFTEYRDIFQKRIIRLSRSGSGLAKPYLKGGPMFVSTIKERLAGITDPGEQLRSMRMGVRELVTLLDTDNTMSVPLSIRAIRSAAKAHDEKIVAGLKRAGLEHISKSTVKKFGSFMDMMREQYGTKMPNSDMLAEFFDRLKYKNKRRSNEFLMQAWKEYEANGYSFTESNMDLFRSK